jgi:dihydrofolate synthase / folylpolyglutamate synthase
MKTVNEWLSKIEKLHPDGIRLGLERIATIANRLEVTSFDCPVVVVAGTNGKGSCVKFLESILYSAGYQVGAYSSPHLLAFNERIRIGNQNISDKDLLKAFEVVEQARQGMPLTFFEFTTLAALWLFKEADLDALLLEVGLGGRLDAVNIVDSDIAIITTIHYDHMEWLGDTRDAIALEKAGIFREEGYAICGDLEPPRTLLEYAKKLRCQFFTAQKDFSFKVNSQNWSWHSKETQFLNLPLPTLPIQNAAASLMSIIKLREHLDISDYAVANGIKTAKLPGRFQVLDSPYPCILDVAHNPASAQMLAQQLDNRESGHKLVAVVGMLADKDIANTLKPLIPRIDRWYFGNLKTPRGAKAMQMVHKLQEFADLNYDTYDCVSTAFLAAANHLNPGDKILVFGSFYTVAEVLYILQNEKLSPIANLAEAVPVS